LFTNATHAAASRLQAAYVALLNNHGSIPHGPAISVSEWSHAANADRHSLTLVATPAAIAA